MALTFVLGGARSGKSGFAQAQAEAEGEPGRLVMIVTAQAFDDEMRARIAQHRRERGTAWRTVEAPHDLPQALEALSETDVVVVDCLTLWLSNLMLGEQADRTGDGTAACGPLADEKPGLAGFQRGGAWHRAG